MWIKRNKQKLFTLLKNIVFTAGMFLICLWLGFVFSRKEAYTRYSPFFEQKENYDVLFLGTSHVQFGVLPMELWDRYGMVSYNLSGNANQIATSYWVLENALDYTTPKLVVMDVSKIGENVKVHSVEKLHDVLDCFPLTFTKLRTISDLFYPDAVDKKGNNIYDRRWEFIWDLQLYHNRWTELTKEDFKPEVSVEKGAARSTMIADSVEYQLIPQNEAMEENTVAQEYLCRMIEDCEKRGIEVLLIYIPFAAGDDLQRAANSVNKISEKYGVDYINFMYEEDLINDVTDFKDLSRTNGHLNLSGARKLTDYLGSYIMENYAISDHRQDADYSKWHHDYMLYREKINRGMEKQKNLDRYLIFLTDKTLEVTISLRQDDILLKNEKYKQLIDNTMQYSGNVKLKFPEETQLQELKDCDIAISVVSKDTDTVIDSSRWICKKSGKIERLSE